MSSVVDPRPDVQTAHAADARRHRFTADEYVAIHEAGVLGDRRTELINGEIRDMAPQNDPHMLAVSQLSAMFFAQVERDTYWPIIQGTFRRPPQLPEPDLAIYRYSTIDGKIKLDMERPPLLIEVSDTSAAYDLGEKVRLYASLGVQEYWVFDLQSRKAVVHRAASTPSSASTEFVEVMQYGMSEIISPRFDSRVQIELSKVLCF